MEHLLKFAGITKGMTPEQGLALKADLGLSWNILRMLRRYSLSSIHIQLHMAVNTHQLHHAIIDPSHILCIYGWIRISQATCSFRWLKEAGVSLGDEKN